MKLLRRILYYALWPLQALFYLADAIGNLLWFLIIVSNPLFLAIYLMNRSPRRSHNENSHPHGHRAEMERRLYDRRERMVH